MNAVEILRLNAESAFEEVLQAINGVTEQESWGILSPAADDYLHSDGSIHGLVHHIATCKFIYGSLAFRNSELRWRHLADRVAEIEPSWQRAVEYLREAQDYWMKSWADLKSGSLNDEVGHFSGRKEPTWKIIQTVTHHDMYHAGQIVVIRYGSSASTTPPPSVEEDIRTHCAALPSW